MSQYRRKSYTTPELNEEAWLNHIFHAYGVRLGSGQLYVDGRNRYVYAASEYVARLGHDGEPQNATDWAESICHRPRHKKTMEVAKRSPLHPAAAHVLATALGLLGQEDDGKWRLNSDATEVNGHLMFSYDHHGNDTLRVYTGYPEGYRLAWERPDGTLILIKKGAEPGWYVADEVGQAGVVGGPFDTRTAAEQERSELNIAEDCGLIQVIA